MISEALAQGLEGYRIGDKVRALRKAKKLGLVHLGEHTGLSPGMLSKIERGQLFPTLPTLVRIAMVFGVGLEHFFVETGERPPVAVVRKRDRLRLPERPGAPAPSYYFESLDFRATDRQMDAYLAECGAGAPPSELLRLVGAEVIFVLTGRLAIRVAEEGFVLDEGDAIYFDSGAPHDYAAEGRAACSAIVVVSAGNARAERGERL
jgi:transcriptional regulator with XRE-family HTH domain